MLGGFNKKRIAGAWIACLFVLVLHSPASALEADIIGLCFSPGGGCTDLAVKEIDQARKDVRVMAYSFTSAPLGKALIRARRRGVDVEVIIDRQKATGRYSEVRFFRNQRIPVYLDSREELMHDKVMVIDSRIVITGSFNWTRAAEFYNAENLLVISSPELAGRYLRNWYLHARHSVLLAPPGSSFW
ncbi:MAG: phospholipase D family protein [Nitrospiraceae bacterium]|nr:phospholipase D family protein [Nitrospiraceae bacterium]